jgi:hypothetical protein
VLSSAFQAGVRFRYTADQRPAVMKIKPYRATPFLYQLSKYIVAGMDFDLL